MPRLKKMSDPEVERKIAARLAELREIRGLSQQELAGQIGLTRGQLSNIELGRSPLRYVHATRALLADANARSRDAYLRPFNPLWLFGKEWPIQLDWPVLLPAPQAIGVSLSLRFSDFVADNLPLLQSLERLYADLPESWLQPYFHHWLGFEAHLNRVERETFTLMENVLVSAVDQAPSSAVARRILEQARAGSVRASNFLNDVLGSRQHVAAPKESSQPVLTTVTPERKRKGMTEMQLLLERIQRALEGVKKGDVARTLRVPLPRLSEWLSGRVIPSGETALRLLHWVEQQERKHQQESPGSVHSPPEQETQHKESNEKKKPKSSRAKR
jgi:transcriptional regulator with XRE-family HTH domain